jgi:predicted HTH domain antitoxin
LCNVFIVLQCTHLRWCTFMGQSITSRLPDDLVKEIEKISKAEQLDKSSVVRRLLSKAIAQWNLENALDAYQKGEVSLGRATEMAKVSIWRFMAKLNERKIPLNYSVEDLEDDLKFVKEAPDF